MPLIEYIGQKARKVDNVAGTGLVWDGPGARHEVAEAAAVLLLKHPTVWALAQAVAPAESEPVTEQPEPAEYRWVLHNRRIRPEDGEAPRPVVLDTMDFDQLAAFAESAGIKVDGRIKDLDKRRAAIYEAATKG